MRDLDARVGADPMEASARGSRRKGRRASALAAQGVVLLQPRVLRGRIVWPPSP
jgi:hypothetical protein